MERKEINENIIVAILMVLVVVALLVFVGFTPIKQWLSTPFVWDEPEEIELTLLSVEERMNWNYLTLQFAVSNSFDEDIDEGTFLLTLDGVECEMKFYDRVGAFDVEVINQTLSCYTSSDLTVDQQTYDRIKTMDPWQIPLTYKTVKLENYDHTLVNNSGIVKMIVIIAASVVLFLIGLCQALPKWLRIILKVCGLPALVIMLAVMLLFGVILASRGGGDTNSSGDDSRMRSAQQRYKNAANHKAGAQMHGNQEQAARAQADMDKAMADMIGANRSADHTAFRSAQERYKRAANHKAGARMHDNQHDAAAAQAEMDRAMADMMKNK